MKSLNKVILVISFLLLTLNCSLLTLNAAVPHLINYQGRLTDKDGKPLEGAYTLTFKIYDSEVGSGTMSPWQEKHEGVLIQKGIFSLLLGSKTNLDLPFDQPYFLEILIGEEGKEEVMSPRQRITSSGYAIRAEKAEGVSGITNFFPTSGNVGIGTTSPTDKLDVVGAIAINSKRIIDSLGNWVGSPTNLVGPTGPQGPTGAQGPQGPQGTPGPAVSTSAACGYTGDNCPGSTINASYYCSRICNGSDKIVGAQCGPCSVTSNTGSCNASTNQYVCCVCKP